MVNSYLTQLLSGYGNFFKHLFKMGKITRPNCINGDASIDDAKHPFCHCERWRLKKERNNLEAKIDTCTIESFCDVILSSEENWTSMVSYTEALLKSKEFVWMREVELTF